MWTLTVTSDSASSLTRVLLPLSLFLLCLRCSTGLLDSWGGLELARPRLQLVRQSVKAGVEAAKLAEEEAKAEARGNGAASEAGAAGAADGSLPPLGSGGTGTAAAGDTPAQDSELPCVSNFRLLKTGGPNVKPLRHCDGCGRHFAKVRGCSSCCVRHYCSKECQVRDWERRHQDECAVLAAVVPRSGPAFDGVVEAAGAAVAAAAAAAAPPAEPEACESPEAASGRHRGRSPQRHASSHKAGAVRRSQASDGGAAAAGAGGARAMPTHSGASSTASSVRGDSSVRGATNASRGVASRSSLEADSLAARTRGLRVSGGAK